METKWLKDFLILSDLGNFRMAALQRNVSQPAFSRRIQALEAWIESPLIDRSSHPSQLTAAGRLFLPVAQNIVDTVEAGKADVQTLVMQGKEKIRFSTLGTIAQIFMPVWLRSLQPFTDVDQFVVNTEYVGFPSHFSALEHNVVDFFIGYLEPRIKLGQDETLFASLLLGKESLVPVCSTNKNGRPRWWLPGKQTEPISCLHTFPENSPWPIKFHMDTKFGDLDFKSVYNSSTGTTLKAMAIEGFGMAWLPRTLVATELETGQLVRAAERIDDILVEIRIFRSLNNHEPRVTKFWKVLLEQEKRAAETYHDPKINGSVA
ncbi:MAG: LysR family transcriptional regulator [Alphaproteobacteria bacterium]|nr:LysR family transcriptional regulator [Alphaproteobacteria bacterium]